MAEKDPFTGPMARDKFMALVDAPYGEAAEKLRELDPKWGRPESEWTKRFQVELSRTVFETATTFIEAASLEEAKQLAEELHADEVDWDYDYSDAPEVESVTDADA